MRSFTPQVRHHAATVIEKERSLEGKYRHILNVTDSVEDRAILRDILLQKEMNELLLRNMFNL